MLDDKYVIFKKVDWDKHLYDLPMDLHEVEDAFVIRSQDVLAPAVLYAYAHELQTMVEFHRNVRPMLTPAEEERLEDMAERIAQQAEKWLRQGRQKLPD